MENNKRQEVEEMFDAIAPRYDLLNHLLSFGIDKGWRKKVAKKVAASSPKKVLDVATGTADLIIAMQKKCGGECKFVGGDISTLMLERGKAKLKKLGIEAELIVADALELPFESGEFDALSCAFGVRNFADVEKGVAEMARVLRSGGVCCILEYSPQKRRSLWNSLFRFYFSKILPFIGGLISGNRAAYSYLPNSVEGFCTESEFLEILSKVGFEKVSARSIMGGVVTLYTGYRKQISL